MINPELVHPEISRISVLPTKEETAREAAARIIAAVNANPTLAITYATGDTMIPVYAELAAAYERGEVDFSQTQAFHLDEYYPTDITEEHSFVRFLYLHVFGPLRIPENNIHTLDGTAEDGNAEAQRYDDLLANTGISVAILGIGPGGHIGFNETGTPFASRTHVAPLSEETVHRDRIERGQNSPDKALTQGIATILEAKEIILIAYGENKGRIISEALFGDISETSPASALRLVGEKVEIVIDEAAASQLR